ncbi:MAG: dTDP-4-dehydrorhamnose 3,5-epimerase family protein [Candidatus Helarchaeota archaeon]
MKLIDGVKIKKLRVIPDERGHLSEILRSDDEIYEKFGQVYYTTAYPGVIKAWHYHKLQSDNFTCIFGMAKIVLFDDREGSPTKGEVNEFFVGVHNPLLIHIPPLIYHGFKCISETEALLINVPTNTYNYDDPDEYRKPFDDPSIPYSWERRNY